ncbi:MAG: hypothetical protein LBC39_08060 [Methanobrevibacter sp.]|jgi:hypothetical protein|nr:hypothetical protein [Candidatus Methanovirga aequatorialis]
MNNNEFLKILIKGFKKYTETGSNSTEKLKIIHGAIKIDLQDLLITNNDLQYGVIGMDTNGGKELKVAGRYITDKSVDIAVIERNKYVGVLEFKFVMQNYSQNSNNYFENMLGQTANMKTCNIPCFQIFVSFENLPYFKDDGKISKIETLSEHNLEKYIMLSKDNEELYFHSPNKTLLIILKNDKIRSSIVGKTKKEYFDLFKSDFNIMYSDKRFNFGNLVIYNDYEKFIKKVVHKIKSI